MLVHTRLLPMTTMVGIFMTAEPGMSSCCKCNACICRFCVYILNKEELTAETTTIMSSPDYVSINSMISAIKPALLHHLTNNPSSLPEKKSSIFSKLIDPSSCIGHKLVLL